MDNCVTESPLISVIILLFNNFSYYEECFLSVLRQSYDNIEIIISDDASNEFNGQKLQEYIEQNNYGNIKNIVINRNKENVGIVKNYNKAISLSKGKYIFYLAVDDILYDEKTLEDVVKYFRGTQYLIFTGYKEVYDSTMTKYMKTLPREIEVRFLVEDKPFELFERLCKGSFISGSNTPFDREIIEKYGYLDEDYFHLEDYPRYLHLAKLGVKIGFYDRKLIKYRTGGLTTNGFINDYLRKDLRTATIKECGEYFKKKWKKKWLEDKDIIGWGTGDCCINSLDKLDVKVKYLVDSNKATINTKINDIDIYSPKELLKENKNSVFILVFSYANYFEIAYELDSLGFEEEKNYFCCTPNILEVVQDIE